MTKIDSERLPQAFDLGPLMNALSRREDKPSVAARGALRHFGDAQSAIHDLIFALEVLEALRTDTERAGKGEIVLPAALQGACFSQVILLYVRAAEVSAERRCLNIRSKLSSEHQILHDKLVKLRNKVIAHLDSDRSYGHHTFVDQRLVIILQDDGLQRLQVADMRLVRQTDTEGELIALVRAALSISAPLLNELQQDVQRHLFGLSKANPKIARLIESKPFNATEFFTDEEYAREWLTIGGIGLNPEKPATYVEGWLDPNRG